MEFNEVINKRYSVRLFKDQKVEQEKLNRLLESARIAPSAVNYNSTRILVLDDEENLTKIKTTTNSHFNAPLVLVVLFDNAEASPGHYGVNGLVNAVIVATTIMYECFDLGLGNTYVQAFDHDKIKELFNIPEYLDIACLLPIGYPSEKARASILHPIRKEMSEFAFNNSLEGIKPGEKHRAHDH